MDERRKAVAVGIPSSVVVATRFESRRAGRHFEVVRHPDTVRFADFGDVGRDGELLHYSNGRHRLALAHVCDVDEIPVVVRVRHREWQALRERVGAADSVEELSERARCHLEHPDLRDVEPE